MYDFSMIKGRLQEELKQVASTSKWNPAVVCIMNDLMKMYRNMEEIQKLQWQQEQKMTTTTTTK